MNVRDIYLPCYKCNGTGWISSKLFWDEYEKRTGYRVEVPNRNGNARCTHCMGMKFLD